MGFKELLTQFRERLGLNKTEFAKTLGISLTHVINMESGDRNPPPMDKVHHIADVLKIKGSEREAFIKSAEEARLSTDRKIIYLRRKRAWCIMVTPGGSSYSAPVLNWGYKTSISTR
jgi:transcriptional regulator with XRE-family HTH domain